jgi:hypothetical protein
VNDPNLVQQFMARLAAPSCPELTDEMHRITIATLKGKI